MAFHDADYHSNRFLPASIEDRLVGLIGRAMGVVVVAVTAFTWLSLVTWSATDPSLTLATSGPVANLGGAPGAIVADLLLQMLGFACVAALMAPMFWGAELILSRQIAGFRGKAAFFPLSVLVLAGAMSALPASENWPINHGYGGILGDFVFGLVASVFAIFNAAHASVATGVLLFTTGASAMVHSIGLELRDVLRILKRPMRAVNWRQKAGSWQNALLSEAKRLRDGVRDTLEAEWPEHPRSATRESEPFHGAHSLTVPVSELSETPQILIEAEASFGDEPQLQDAPTPPAPMLSLRAQHTEPQAPLQNEVKAKLLRPSSWLRPLPPNPILSESEPIAAQTNEPSAPSAMPEAALSIAEQFAAYATDSQSVEVEDDEEELMALDDDDSSRAIAARFAPFASQAKQQVRSAPILPSKSAPSPSDPAPAVAGTTVPTMMRHDTRQTARTRYTPPSTRLLSPAAARRASSDLTMDILHQRAQALQNVLADFGVKGSVKNIRPGPVVTLYEFEPARGTKSSRVISLADDIARSMSAVSARVAVVTGRNAIGIELPNSERQAVVLREVFESGAFRSSQAALPLALGKSIGGDPVIADLARMPHLLVAGTTGSGKSVGVNAMVLSILYRHTPEACRLLMIDPKMLELSVYNDIPHLLSPVITDPQKAITALNWAVREMEERYKRMSKLSVRNVGVYNNRVRNAKKRGERLSRTVHTGFDAQGQAVYEQQTMDLEELPYIVIVVDEFADLMLVAGKEIEAAIQRLAQMARAAGIHLIMATQRPSVDVITGTIKANFPTRVSFKVTSKVDSRTILNEQGAEQLLGQGDMLYAAGGGQTVRVHGPFVSDEEVEAIAAHLKAQGAPNYIAAVVEDAGPPETTDTQMNANGDDLYEQAVAIVQRDGKASTSYIQRRLSIGYNRAANLVERMEDDGIIGPPGSGGKREILRPLARAGSESAA